ncbi:hypothetical protein GF108_19535 [Phyllobacterium sp. SYP-B3895]|nr:hypothetical protein [Phyllobacterium sp. SYP-B3895]
MIEPTIAGLDELKTSSGEQQFSEAETYLLSRLAGVAGIDHWLNDVRVDAAMRVCEMVGVAAARVAQGGTQSLSERELHSCTQSGFQLLQTESGLNDLCDELKRECTRKNL